MKTQDNLQKFNYKKSLGQNFLTDAELLSNIAEVADVDGKTVLEIGCGAGALTRELLKRAKKVIGYEIDQRLFPVLEEIKKQNGNFEPVFKDIMKERLENVEKKTGGEYVLVANLPYYITTPIITRFLENSTAVQGLSVMVQEEVAERLAAKEGTSEYGAITVAVNLRGSAKIVMRVGRDKFTPAPNVDSAVVKIDIEKDKFKGVNLNKVREVVRCAFSSRRKTLANNIINVYKIPRQKAEDILTDAGVNVFVRGEKLSAADFVKLSETLTNYGL